MRALMAANQTPPTGKTKQDSIETAICLLLVKRGRLTFWSQGDFIFCQYEGPWGAKNYRMNIMKSGATFPEAFRDLISVMVELKDK